MQYKFYYNIWDVVVLPQIEEECSGNNGFFG